MRGQVVKKLQDHWEQVIVPGRLERFTPAPWQVSAKRIYDGGYIEIGFQGKTVLEVNRDVEFGRLEIQIPGPFEDRSAKILTLLSQICDRCIEQAELERQSALQDESAAVLAALDELPDEIGVPVTMWAISTCEVSTGSNYTAGPFADEKTATNWLGAGEIAVESRDGVALRGITLDEAGRRTWLNAEDLAVMVRRNEAATPALY